MNQPAPQPLHQFRPVLTGQPLVPLASEWNAVRAYVAAQLQATSQVQGRPFAAGFLRVKLIDAITDETAHRPAKALILDFNASNGTWFETDFQRLVWRWREEEIEAGTECACQAYGAGDVTHWFVVPVECPEPDDT